MGHTLVNTDRPVLAIKVISVSMESCTIGWGMEVADCTRVIQITEVRDKNIQSDQPQGESLAYGRNWPDPICEMVKEVHSLLSIQKKTGQCR